MKKNDLEELFKKSSLDNYENGKYVSKQYTKEELKAKIKYYEEKEHQKECLNGDVCMK